MSDAKATPPQPTQEDQARQSPLKKPETETAHADTGDVAKAAATHQDGPRPSQQREHNAADAPPTDAATRQRVAGREPSVFPEDIVPRGVDVDNDDSSDSTLDTDGKDRDAKRLVPLNDSEVVSNATDQNVVPTPPNGLAGIDSRPGGNRPGILVNPGSKLVDEGVFESERLYETAGDDSEEEARVKKDEHVPANHARVGLKFRIDTK